jgi:hypothetical protein
MAVLYAATAAPLCHEAVGYTTTPRLMAESAAVPQPPAGLTGVGRRCGVSVLGSACRLPRTP